MQSNAQDSALPGFHSGMFIGQHGSWNRQPHSGYKVVFVPFTKGQPKNVLASTAALPISLQSRPRYGALLMVAGGRCPLW